MRTRSPLLLLTLLVAMAGSVSAMAAVVVGDLSDEVMVDPSADDPQEVPVTVKKVDHRPELAIDELLQHLAIEKPHRNKYGSFEGY